MNKKQVVITTEENQKCVIQSELFDHFQITYNDNCICFSYNKDILTGLIGFTMFDTYGFPVELVNEILLDKLDMEGYLICRKLQQEKSSGTFNNSSAFN